jgi:hypothetical protein
MKIFSLKIIFQSFQLILVEYMDFFTIILLRLNLTYSHESKSVLFISDRNLKN